MKFIQENPNPSGAYPAIQNLDFIPAGWLPIGENCDTTPFYDAHGFVMPTIADGVVTAFTPDMAAWAAWQAAHPVVTKMPTTEDDILETVLDHEARLANLELLGGTT